MFMDSLKMIQECPAVLGAISPFVIARGKLVFLFFCSNLRFEEKLSSRRNFSLETKAKFEGARRRKAESQERIAQRSSFGCD
jgi:hypothetical protein